MPAGFVLNYYGCGVRQMAAAAIPRGRRRGKSGLHRAGCQITSGGGDSRDSATKYTASLRKQAGKGGRAV